MRRNCKALPTMTTAALPSLRVSADLREAAQSVLLQGESLSEDARSSGYYHAAATVHDELQRKLDARRKQVLG